MFGSGKLFYKVLKFKSFFKFCEFCLNRYDNDQSVYHISGCNFFPSSSEASSSYHLTSIVNIWGWATWANRWKYFEKNPEHLINDFSEDSTKDELEKITFNIPRQRADLSLIKFAEQAVITLLFPFNKMLLLLDMLVKDS